MLTVERCPHGRSSARTCPRCSRPEKPSPVPAQAVAVPASGERPATAGDAWLAGGAWPAVEELLVEVPAPGAEIRELCDAGVAVPTLGLETDEAEGREVEASNPAEDEGLATGLSQVHVCLDQLVSAPAVHDLLEIEMAVVLDGAQHEDGSPLWLIPIGRSGSGKTEVARALKGKHTRFVSELASGASFLSGAVDSRTHQHARSLLTDLNGRCMVIKDLASSLSEHPDKAKATLGKLCDIYDGEYSKGIGTSFGSSAILEAKSRFSMVANATPQLWRKHQRLVEDIGTRALHVILPALTAEQREEGFKPLQRTDRSQTQATLRTAIEQHLDAVIAAPSRVHVPAEVDSQLKGWAELVAVGRTPILWERITTAEERTKWVWSPGEPEDPYRAYYQLRRLLVLLTRLNGRCEPTAHELRLVRWVALSSVSLDRALVLLAMRSDPVVRGERRGITAQAVASALVLSDDQARHRLEEMVRVGLLTKPAERASDGSVGAPSALYVPVPAFEALVFGQFTDKSVLPPMEKKEI